MASRFLRQPDVISRTGLSSSTILRLELAGRFPRRRQIAPNSVGWLEEEIEQWISSRPRSVSQDSVHWFPEVES